jgi:uncharacterized protein (TIGR02145 family)
MLFIARTIMHRRRFTMRSVVPLFIIMAFAALCNAQTYTISGVVKNNAGTGIEGAALRLGLAGISTITGTGGNFTLIHTVGTAFRTSNTVTGMQSLKVLRDGRLSFTATHKGEVRVMVYDCKGRLQISLREIVSSGNNLLSLPRLADGMYIYQVTVEERQYSFKSLSGMAAGGPVSAMNAGTAAGFAKTAASFDDALLAAKDGYQLYRLGITNPDTSGIQITLVPLVTGTVTDMDQIVYQTVQIGNQVWTTQNLRTTKYNDGTPVINGTDETVWENNTTGAYCFYNKSTDAAYQQKWGALYNWYAANTGKLAPAGWRVPTPADWDTLFTYLMVNGYSYDGVLWGDKCFKALASKTDWVADTTSSVIGNELTQNNSSGFSALPAGSRSSNGTYDGQGLFFYWWLPKEMDSSNAWFRRIDNNNNLGMYFPTAKSCGFSIRLVRDH